MPQGGPAAWWATAILQRADENKDGKLSIDELLAATKKLFDEVDKDKNGMLSDEELAAGINLLMPQPPGFRPPGQNPGGGREDRPRRDAEKAEPKP
jgi:hypothetical protein